MDARKKLDTNIYVMGLISMLMDISSEMVYPVLPVFLSSVLGIKIAYIGLIEGVAESAAGILKGISGWISDVIKKRKTIIFLGYALSAVTKPFLFFASLGWHVLAVRLIDRIGKGVRGAPRDALIADSCLHQDRGMAFGIQRAMDNLGAFLGPLLAWLLLNALNKNYRALFLISFIPALAAVIIIALFLKEKKIDAQDIPADKIKIAQLAGSFKAMNKEFIFFIAVVGLFTLGNSSKAFLILRAQELGVGAALIPIYWLVFNFFSSISAAPLGRLSDVVGRPKAIKAGLVWFSFVYFGFAFSYYQFHAWLLIAIYGIFIGLSEGVLRAHVADIVTDSAKRGTAYGIFNTVEGLLLLPASLIMGGLWQSMGAVFAFSFGAVLAIAAALMFTFMQKTANFS